MELLIEARTSSPHIRVELESKRVSFTLSYALYPKSIIKGLILPKEVSILSILKLNIWPMKTKKMIYFVSLTDRHLWLELGRSHRWDWHKTYTNKWMPIKITPR